jgi:signal transduction histidine kinase
VVAAVVAAVTVLTAAFNIVLGRQLDSDVDQLLRDSAAAHVAALETVDGRLAVGEAPDAGAPDARAWVFAGRRALERPPTAGRRVEAAANALAGGPRRTLDVSAPETRLLAVPVSRGRRRLGTVVVAASRAPYERTERTALVASSVFAALLILAAGAAAAWLLRAALRPVARMTADAAEWSERDLDRRFAVGAAEDELGRLAQTLDALLDRVAAGMRREQQLSAELSHELRTPLAKLSMRAQLLASAPELAAPLREEAKAIVRSTAEMADVIDLLMTAARAEADGGRAQASDLVEAVRSALDAAAPQARERALRLELDAPAAVPAHVDPRLVARLLAPLLENACRMARTQVKVTLVRDGAWAELVVADDGPGVEPADAAAIFDPGHRASKAGDAHPGAGLGLALARRLARSAGGEVVADPSAGGGRFVVRLPLARPSGAGQEASSR